MKITKHRDQDSWRISVDGRPSTILIVKGDRPKFREPQGYAVMDGEDYLFDCKSVGGAMIAIERLVGLPLAIEKATGQRMIAHLKWMGAL